jgi:predicted nucleic acid-binding protein
MIVLDTNVLSEVLRPEPSNEVSKWLAKLEKHETFITTITVAETFYGVEQSHNASVATRNVRDFNHCGVRLINPWDS